MNLTPKEIIKIIQVEINWCLDNPNDELNHDQRMGFVNGLRQAQILIEKFSRVVEDKDVIVNEDFFGLKQ